MHAEEEIKNQMVDSHQSKAWHTANSLRNSSPSFPHKYLPCVTALSETSTFKPLWLAAGYPVLPSHPDHPLPQINSQEPTMFLAWPGLCLATTTTGGASSILLSCTATDLLLLVDPGMGLGSPLHSCLWLRAEWPKSLHHFLCTQSFQIKRKSVYILPSLVHLEPLL